MSALGVESAVDIPTSLQALLSNLGIFAPVAWLGWWIIKNQRSDIIAERDRYADTLAKERIEHAQAEEAERKRNDALADRVFALADSSNKTIKELSSAINEISRQQ